MNIIYYQNWMLLGYAIQIIMLMVIYGVGISVHVTIQLQRNNWAMGPSWY